MKPLEIFLIVFVLLTVISLIIIFASIIKNKSKNNKVLSEYFGNKAERLKASFKNKGTTRITEKLYSSKIQEKD